MPHSKSHESGILRQPIDPIQDDKSSDSFGSFSSSASVEKDAVETELERMVFGDDAGFQQELRNRAGATKDFSLGQPKIGASEDEIEDQDLFRGVDDADLFFVDSGPSAIHSVDQDVVIADKGRGHSPDAYGAAWIDSDDERVQVSLSSNPRLRKLRLVEGEDYINGEDYVKRLRRQYERLHPTPEWASQSISKKHLVKKRKRQIDGTNGSDEGSLSGSDASSDNDDLSARPLASLLQNAGSLSQSVADARHRKKLRPEMIDIQRSRDVGPTQPSSITSLAFHPLHPLLLSSGPAATLWLNHVSPQPPNPNPLLTSLHVRGTSIATSAFHPTARARVVFSGRRRYFHSWDLSTGKVDKISHIAGHQAEQKSMEKFKISPCGRWMGLVGSRRKGGGLINVLDLQTNQWVAEVRVEGKGGVADFEWWGDGEGMTVLGK
ncbi:MAG: hypothetical protein Q9214_000948, partial [Letrouitia sp. 1 TL-2023]